MATKCEDKLRTYRALPARSTARAAKISEWKPFFQGVSDKIKQTQTATNEAPYEAEVRKWLAGGRINPNEVDQPMLPSRDLTMDEKLQATTVLQLKRGDDRKDRLNAALAAAEAEMAAEAGDEEAANGSGEGDALLGKKKT
jgi:hypothetical protein